MLDLSFPLRRQHKHFQACQFFMLKNHFVFCFQAADQVCFQPTVWQCLPDLPQPNVFFSATF